MPYNGPKICQNTSFVSAATLAMEEPKTPIVISKGQSIEPRTVKRIGAVDTGMALLFYSGGTAALYLVDMLVAARMPAEEVASWALTKSLILIIAPLATIGVDRALIRLPQTPLRVASLGWLQAALLSAPIVAIVTYLRDDIQATPFFLACLGAGALLWVGGYFRSIYRMALTELSIHAWKLPFLWIVMQPPVLSYQGIVESLGALLLVWACVLSMVAVLAPTQESLAQSSYRSLYSLGRRFWLFALLTSASVYLDQVLLNSTGQSDASAAYFRYVALFLPIPQFVSGLLSSISNPILRAMGNEVRNSMRRIWLGVGAAIVATSAAAVVLGHVINRYMDVLGGAPTPTIVAAMVGVGALRILYVVPSAVVSIFGDASEMDRYAMVSAASVGVLVLTYLLALSLGVGGLAAIVAAVSVNMVLKDGYGVIMACRIYRSGRDLDAPTIG